ncbi:hypothetical protein MACJ_002186 [Theileria orientalis]|uniref:Uncharacterized protein n=1 Tax=Theileria orientalis TaxID=68886 RepID=A0A976M853_THEOR|nr:hypothetical protein MACJ_002186 [Theileria orientalis]
MQSDVDKFIASTRKEVSNHFRKSGDLTQSASHDFLGEVLQKPGDECQFSESALKNSDMSNIRSMSTKCAGLAETNSNLSEDAHFVNFINDIQPLEPFSAFRSKNLRSEVTTNVQDINDLGNTDKTKQNLDHSNKTESAVVFNKASNEDVSKSLRGDMTKKFSNLCEILDTEKAMLQKLDNELKISKILHSKDFGRDLNLSRKATSEPSLMEDLKASTGCDNVAQYIAKKKRKGGRPRKNSNTKVKKGRKKRTQTKPKVKPSGTMAVLKALEKGKPLGNRGKNKTKRPGRPKGKGKKAQVEEGNKEAQSESTKSSADPEANPVPNKTLDVTKDDEPKPSPSPDPTADAQKASIPRETTTNTEKPSPHTESTTNTEKALPSTRPATNTEKAFIPPVLTTNAGTSPVRELRRSVMDTDVLENLDKIGGIKYETGSVDLRRKYRSFERLCFGLGCTVPPTKQELEMCSQLSLWGDDSSLSQYETSVYQSCLLRSRSFESIWRKFCNRVIGIIRRYTLQGVKRLLRIINEQNLVEPFLKVVLVDLGSDRQDQQLFISILQEELNQTLREKQMLLKVTVTNNNSVDDIVNQIYIQMYQLLLLSSAATSASSTDLRIGRSTEPKDQYYYYLHQDYVAITRGEKSWSESQFSGENLLDGLVKLYENFFSDNELVVIIDKINPMINDVLYMFQMLKRRRLMKINSVLIVCSNNEYLETYCNSLIYSNLGIFECSMFMISCLVDDIVQVLLYDTKVQDFIPNFRMVKEIYETFINQDSSLTLMILRVYQLYEQYYNNHIFSYLSIVPPFVFESQKGAPEYDIVMDLNSHWIFPSSPYYEPRVDVPEPNTTKAPPKGRPKKRAKADPKGGTKRATRKSAESAAEGDAKDGDEAVKILSEQETVNCGGDENNGVAGEAELVVGYKNQLAGVFRTHIPGFITGNKELEQVVLPPESLMKSTEDTSRLSDMSTTTSLNNITSMSKYGSPYSATSDIQTESSVRKRKDLSGSSPNTGTFNASFGSSRNEPFNRTANTGRTDTTGAKIGGGSRIVLRSDSESTSNTASPTPSKPVNTARINTRSNTNSANTSLTSNKSHTRNTNNSIRANNNLNNNRSQGTNNSNDNKQLTTNTTNNQLHTVTNTNNINTNTTKNQPTTSSTTQLNINNSGIGRVSNFDEMASWSREVGPRAFAETTGFMADFDYEDSSDVEYERYGDLNKTTMLKRAKRMYSLYSLLSISNNMSENYVAYLELKLVEELDLQKVILELLPLNTLILMQRRILFQLGVNFLYKLLIFLPDSAMTMHRITHLLNAMPMFDQKPNDEPAEDLDKPLKDLIKRVIKYMYKKCHLNMNKEEGIESLRNIVVSFNHHYRSVIQTVMDIQLLLDGGRNVYETDHMIYEYSTVLDEKLSVPKLAKDIRFKLHMCFFPLIVTYKLASIMGVQRYTNTFGPAPGPQGVPSPAPAATTLTTVGPRAAPTVGDMATDMVDEQDIILYIYKYIRYKIINMWKLFIIYYYIATSRQARPARRRGLVEIYVKFNVNIELLEKIHKIVLLSQTTSAFANLKDSRSLMDTNLTEGDVQLCCLMKNSLSNINVKFL